ncbi:hypothetical protein NLJ89_g8518 [Agrocybe chaxingu]|uniref:Uncharacterized protein n=1 Tax=Agrocybe chaxingu TaxID=84603 RepID=A0A9W8JUQ8_9AGAR|nr:hypothetical protein NLJ89_g8518 [Agrocybe chaxingu]
MDSLHSSMQSQPPTAQDDSKSPLVVTIEQVLQGHKDEIWNICWSNSGKYLASASKDHNVIIWKKEEADIPTSGWIAQHTLRHSFPAVCLAWSPDDSVLVTSAESMIKFWDTTTGSCTNIVEKSSETITKLEWLPDGSGLISAGLDGKIIFWNANGTMKECWETHLKVFKFTISPDLARLVAVGEQTFVKKDDLGASKLPVDGTKKRRLYFYQMITYDLPTGKILSTIFFEDGLTSIRITKDSRFALINCAPSGLELWDICEGRKVEAYAGPKQERTVIGSCFGGEEEKYIISGSEDSQIYIYDRDDGVLLNILSGHGKGCVSTAAVNPFDHELFATCSDDRTVRLWRMTDSFDIIRPSDIHDDDIHDDNSPVDPAEDSWVSVDVLDCA